MSDNRTPVVTAQDIANADALERWADLQKRAARAVGLACDAWADVTGGRCYAEIEGESITIRTVKSASQTNGAAPGKRGASAS